MILCFTFETEEWVIGTADGSTQQRDVKGVSTHTELSAVLLPI